LGRLIKGILSIGLAFSLFAILVTGFFTSEILFDTELILFIFSTFLFLLYIVLGGLFIRLQSNAKIGSEVVDD